MVKNMNEIFDFASEDVLLDIDSICKKMSISRSTLDRLRNPASKKDIFAHRGEEDFSGVPPFPDPIKIGGSLRWSAKKLNEWLEKQKK